MRGRSKSMYASSNKLANFESDSSDDDIYQTEDKLANIGLDSSDDDVYQTEGETSLSAENNVNIIRKVWEQLPKFDNIPFDRRLEQINWDRIADDKCTPHKMKQQFENFIAPVRKYRILSEILKDLEKHILSEVNLPKKPLPAFSIFAEEHKNLIKTKVGSNKTRGLFSKIASEEFKHLSEQEKERYRQKSNQMKKEYRDIVAKFNLEDKFSKKSKLSKAELDNPVAYYHDQLKSQGFNIKFQEARKLFSDLSKKEKLSLILEFLGVKQGEKLNLNQYKKAKEVLSKDDMAMVDDYEGRPKTMSAYNAFMKDFLASNRTSTELQWSELFKTGVEKWRQLSAEKKSRYENASAKRKIKYKEEYDEYLASLPPDRQEFETSKNKGKHKNVKDDCLGSGVNNSLNYSKATPKKRKSKKSITATTENVRGQPAISPDKLKRKRREEKSLSGKDETDTYVPEEFSPKKKKLKLSKKFDEDEHNLSNESSQEILELSDNNFIKEMMSEPQKKKRRKISKNFSENEQNLTNETSQEKVVSANSRIIEEIKEEPINQKKIKLSKNFVEDEQNSSNETSQEKLESKNRFIKEIKQEQEKGGKLPISMNLADDVQNLSNESSQEEVDSRNRRFIEEIQEQKKQKKIKLSKNFIKNEQNSSNEMESRNTNFAEEIKQKPQKQKKLKISMNISEDEQNLSNESFQEKVYLRDSSFNEEIKQKPQKNKKLKTSKNLFEDGQNSSNEIWQEKLVSRNEEIKEKLQKQKKLKLSKNFAEDDQNSSNEISQEKLESSNNSPFEEIKQKPQKNKKLKTSKNFAEDDQNSSNEISQEKLESSNNSPIEEIKQKPQKNKKLKTSKNFAEDDQNSSNEISQEKLESRNNSPIEEIKQKPQKKKKLKISKNSVEREQNLNNATPQEKVESRNSSFIEEINEDQEIFSKVVRECPKKPPSSLRKFYASEIFKGPSSQGKVYYDALSRKEKKSLKAKHDRAKNMHLQELQTFIKSLSKKEILYFQKHGFPSAQVDSDMTDELDALDLSENSDDSDSSKDRI